MRCCISENDNVKSIFLGFLETESPGMHIFSLLFDVACDWCIIKLCQLLVHGVFWLNIAKSEIYLRYRYCFNLFSEMRKESEFQQHRCRNSTKV